MSRECYEELGRPSFRVNDRSDAAEEVTYAAERHGVRFRTLFPTSYERMPAEGAWPLGGYGWYGVGTVFGDGFYHLFQSRFGDNAQLFVKRCEEILDG